MIDFSLYFLSFFFFLKCSTIWLVTITSSIQLNVIYVGQIHHSHLTASLSSKNDLPRQK